MIELDKFDNDAIINRLPIINKPLGIYGKKNNLL